ncbi:response regulator transcription factor [Cellulomonas sp. URHD0024]|uniref:LuxR C-terminal-related transcriptional regulator n=1 Tax=Cellulomonas sp. URHD0024 TaxID=1302620 RepID=UPI0018C97582|nr:response regulator transcription factor [Cellulomonas sp. URHD0024]
MTTTLTEARPRHTTSDVVRVCIEGGDAITRTGIATLLTHDADLAAVQPEHGPDITLVVLDTVTPRGLAEVRSLAARGDSRVVVVVGDLSTDVVAVVLQAGAVGLLRRHDVTGESLAQLLRSVAGGDAVVPPDLLSALLPHSGGDAPAPRMLALATLTERERAVLEMLGDGSDTREIARRLAYSERTVKTIIQDITRRFGLRNRSHAVAYAVRHGLI